MDRNSKLKEALNIATNLARLAKLPEYTQYFLPYLKKLATVQFINPTNFKTDEEYRHALSSANIRAGAYAEIINFLDSQESVMNSFRQKLEEPTKSDGI